MVAATSEFTAEERNLLVRLPRWVVGAASAAHAEGPGPTRRKLENGFLAVANGGGMGNALLRELADASVKIYDEDPQRSGIDPTTAQGSELVIGYSQTAMSILRAKAEAEDAATYRRWLLDVVDYVITDVRHERRGFGSVHVHPDEKRFRDRLADATRLAAPPA